MTELRWVAAGLLAVISAAVTLGNFGLILRWLISKKGSSQVPVLGGLAGLLAMLVAPSAWLQAWWWAPLLVDPGTAPLLAATAWDALRRRRGQP